MNTSPSKSNYTSANFQQIPQVKIRSGLRAGASLDNCENALDSWKRSYYKWYEVAKYKSV